MELTEEGRNLFEYIENSIETINNAENVFSKYINLDEDKIRIAGWDTLLRKIKITKTNTLHKKKQLYTKKIINYN